MKLINETEVSLPLFSTNKGIREARKQKYVEIGKKLYPNAPKMTAKIYDEIKKTFKNGDLDSTSKLLEYSIDAINESVASIFAKYDIEEVISYEEVLSYSLERMCFVFQKFDKLPELCSSYVKSLMNFYVFKFVHRAYAQAYLREISEVPMPLQSVAWNEDKNNSYEMNFRDINNDDIVKLINKACERLTKRQKQSILYKFGFVTGKTMSDAHIGRLCNITRGRVHSLVTTAVGKLGKSKEMIRLNREYADEF